MEDKTMQKDAKARVIAFYLPQYHPFKENDEWWGKGFTEWTNVGKAKPLFHGHYQPKVPADLGYYDLRLPIVREQQAELAREAGIEGFCYYHYWFGDGFQLLERPFNEVVRLKKPDFPFCLCWANESWHAKFWNKDGHATSKKVLAEQKYLGREDNEKHFYSLLDAFKDERYIKVDGKLLFVIYRPFTFENLEGFINDWNELAAKNNLPGFHFIGQINYVDELEANIRDAKSAGLSALTLSRLWVSKKECPVWKKIFDRITMNVFGIPAVYSYKKAIKKFVGPEFADEYIYPTIIPNWDHSPRSGKNGYILTGSTPELFGKHTRQVLDIVDKKQNKIVFLKSWNEWGEGNYMEPDLRYGKGYIQALKKELDK